MGLRNDTRIVRTTTLDNSFSWQVGYHDYAQSNDLPQFRATIRPLTNDEQYNRIPNGTVLYEETGIRINSADNLGSWSFPLSVNAGLAGGPYREYQVVIEAHDAQGNTSAGNRVGTIDESNWSLYPYGYDIIAVSNPRTTGIEMSDNLTTTNYYTTGWSYYILVTGASDSKYQISGTAGLIGAGLFSGSGLFTGSYVMTNLNYTQDGLSYNQNFTGHNLFTGFGSWYLGNTFLGSNIMISGSSKYTGVYNALDSGEKTLPRTGEYGSRGFINGEGGVRIQFTDGDIPSDIVGGYLYIFTGRFPKKEAAINVGHWGQVQKTRFDFDPKYRYVNHPSAASNFRGAPYLYTSISFYDEMDELTLINSPDTDISTGLYVSNTSILYNDTAPGTVSLGGIGTILVMKVGYIADLTDLNTISTTYLPPNYRAIAATSSDNITSLIYYVSTLIPNSPYAGTPGGNATTSGAAGGGGGSSVSTPGSLGSVTYAPPSPDVPPLDVTLTVGGSATRIHYKTTAITVDSSPTSYSTKIGTSVTTSITSNKRLWARASDGANHSSWQYGDYTN